MHVHVTVLATIIRASVCFYLLLHAVDQDSDLEPSRFWHIDVSYTSVWASGVVMINMSYPSFIFYRSVISIVLNHFHTSFGLLVETTEIITTTDNTLPYPFFLDVASWSTWKQKGTLERKRINFLYKSL